ncbi:MAG: SCP2 sterol-binding domain-containing protein [Thermoleophilia bacterium]|nr:SCP2 sterol-binding domain-containing protein [Thermoleophilia bacterium]
MAEIETATKTGGVLLAELERVIEEQRRRFLDPRVASSFRGWNKTMQYSFTDTGEHFYFRFVDGAPEQVLRGKAEGAEIMYEMDTSTFFAITRRELSGLKAYQQKRVKLRASLPDMLKLQKIEGI